MYREIKEPVFLCNDKGNLNPDAIGWSKQPYHMCNLSHHYWRKKKWTYMCFTSDSFLLSITLSNIGYISLGCVYFMEYDKKNLMEESYIVPFALNSFFSDVEEGNEYFYHWNAQILFYRKNGKRYLSVNCRKFKGTTLTAELVIDDENRESYNAVIPWSEKHFMFTNKKTCVPVSGEINIGKEKFSFSKNNSNACIDFNRGVWPYKTSWNWASFSHNIDGTATGVSLIRGYSEQTGVTENVLYQDTKVKRIDQTMMFDYNKKNYMEPWKIFSEDSKKIINLTFNPFFERRICNFMLILNIQIHQLFGHFTGTISDDNNEIRIDNVFGWSEEWYSRW